MDGGDDDDEHQVSAGVTLCSYFSRLLDQLSEKKSRRFRIVVFSPHMRSRHRISPPIWELAPILLFLIEIFPSSGRGNWW